MTEMEILHALVNPLHRGRVRDPNKPGEFYEPVQHAFFYLRDKAYLEQLPPDLPQLRQVYTNEGLKIRVKGIATKNNLNNGARKKSPARAARSGSTRRNGTRIYPLRNCCCPSSALSGIKMAFNAGRRSGTRLG